VRARVDGVDLRGVANIGFNPTFGDRERAVETHLFDFDDDIYGHRLEVAFVERLREERKFSDVESLIDQIRRDIATARELFSRR
jgi:riboflavin kinase / FMN adenylyltransferase